MAFVNLLSVIYPVGSVYLSINAASPAGIIGGTWEKVSGYYLLTGDDSQTTGGSDTISWTYGVDFLSYYGEIANFNQDNFECYVGLWNDNTNSFYSGNRVHLDAMTGVINSSTTTAINTINNVKHEGTTMTITKDLKPSYYTVHCWVRTA